jgi:fructokinase
MLSEQFTIVGLGELIWDLLPTGRQLGGAPANCAYHAHLLGDRAIVASRVGADALGAEAAARLAQQGIETAFLQRDAEHPTGTVGVEIDAKGEPTFAVNQNSAWDYLAWTEAWATLAARADAVCFGTLGQRAPTARATILRFLAATRPGALRLFDVNLRHSFFTPDMLRRSLELATVVKLNRPELTQTAEMLGFDERAETDIARRLLTSFDLRLVAVTHGASGSLLVNASEASAHPGFRVQVADAIGAGDAFAAALAHGLLRGASLTRIGAAANRLGAWVASRVGATPPPEPELIAAVTQELN